jgi:hypothetical protein
LRGVRPRLATHTIGEIVSSTTHSQVEDKEEFSVEWCGIGFVLPRVVEVSGEITFLPERLLSKINFKNLVVWVVEVSVKTALVPIKTVDMEISCEGFTMLVVLVSKGEFVLIPVRSPMKS